MRYSRSDIAVLIAGAAMTAAGVFVSLRGGSAWPTWFFGFCTLVLCVAPWLRRRRVAGNERVEFDSTDNTRSVVWQATPRAPSPISPATTVETTGSRINVIVDRDSVAAGDDSESHQARFEIDDSSSVAQLIDEALRHCKLASIAGGEATWLIDVGGTDRQCIGVVAQQWPAPKLTIEMQTTVRSLFSGAAAQLHFRYWCQADPQAVFDAVRSGTELPSRYR